MSSKQDKVMGLYANSQGYGYALMENPLSIKIKGSVCTNTKDNKIIMQQIRQVIRAQEPKVIVLEEMSNIGRKSKRIQELMNLIKSFARKNDIRVQSYSRGTIRTVFAPYRAAIKYEIYEVLARNIPELEYFFFEKPVYPDNEPSIARMFDAVSLGVVYFYLNA